MSNQKGKYNIKAVSKLLGIQPGTLRAWERRYKMIAPIRNESGHRLYTEEHTKILEWLMIKVSKGYTISQAVNLLESNQVTFQDQLNIKNDETDLSVDLMDELFQSFINFDEKQAHELLNRAFSIYTIDKVVVEILGALHIKVRGQRESGNISSANESFAYSFLRSRIGMILHTLPVDGLLPKVIAVCGPGESHELSLLMFTFFLRRKGFEVIYIGASIANDDFDNVLEKLKPKFLFLSCTFVDNVKETIDLIDRLSSKYKQLQIGLGGEALKQVTNQIPTPYEKYLVGYTKQEWEIWLKEKLG